MGIEVLKNKLIAEEIQNGASTITNSYAVNRF